MSKKLYYVGRYIYLKIYIFKNLYLINGLVMYITICKNAQ